MSLNIYRKPSPEAIIEEGSPLAVTFNGIVGGAIDTRLFIRNKLSSSYYTNIIISSVDNSSPDYTNGSNKGCYWKFAEKEIPLTNEEWELIDPGNSLTLSSSIGSSSNPQTSTYYPFWLRISMSPGFDIQTISSIIIKINATKILI